MESPYNFSDIRNHLTLWSGGVFLALLMRSALSKGYWNRNSKPRLLHPVVRSVGRMFVGIIHNLPPFDNKAHLHV